MTEQARRLMKNYYRKNGQPDFPPIMVVMIHGSDRDDEGTQSSISKERKETENTPNRLLEMGWEINVRGGDINQRVK